MKACNNNIKIRVYILNWNGGEDLSDCINSLKTNKSQKFSITVIDNNSSDNSLSSLPQDVTIVPLDKNYGFSSGYNIGVKKSIDDKDEFIVLLNYDTIVKSNFIESIIQNLNSKDSRESIYGVKILYYNNQDIIWYAGGKVSLEKGIIRHIGLRDKQEKYVDNYDTDYITGCCMIMHKDIFSKLNGFDDRFFMYNEDVDFCLRARRLGFKNKFLFSPVILHKVSASLGGNYSIKKIFMKLESGYKLYAKYYSSYMAIILTIIYFIRTIVTTRKNKI